MESDETGDSNMFKTETENPAHKNPYIKEGTTQGNDSGNNKKSTGNWENSGKSNIKNELNKQLEKQKLQQNKNEKKQEDKSRKQKMIDQMQNNTVGNCPTVFYIIIRCQGLAFSCHPN